MQGHFVVFVRVNMYKYLLLLIPFTIHAQGYRDCESWDTFCKSPEQIVATKCRLGVPVKWGYCEELNIPKRYLIRGGGSLVEALPVTDYEAK